MGYPYLGTFTNSEYPDEMRHTGSTLFVKVKDIFRL